MRTVAFCEIDPFCRRVLAKHWPGVPIFDDVRTITGEAVGPVDVICGGFPCQDISSAGARVGIDGERSGLWSEYARVIGEIRPRYVVVENVADLLIRGMGRVLGDLAAIGYDAEWHCIPAAAVGADHTGRQQGMDKMSEHPFGYSLEEMDVEAFFNMRDWLQRACEAQGAKMVGGGVGMGQADIDIDLDGCRYNISIKPLPVTSGDRK